MIRRSMASVEMGMAGLLECFKRGAYSKERGKPRNWSNYRSLLTPCYSSGFARHISFIQGQGSSAAGAPSRPQPAAQPANVQRLALRRFACRRIEGAAAVVLLPAATARFRHSGRSLLVAIVEQLLAPNSRCNRRFRSLRSSPFKRPNIRQKSYVHTLGAVLYCHCSGAPPGGGALLAVLIPDLKPAHQGGASRGIS